MGYRVELVPKGSWSKNWELREVGECSKCPTGVVCSVDAMTVPCNRGDLPTPYEPVGNLDGAPVTEYLYASYNRRQKSSRSSSASIRIPATSEGPCDSKIRFFLRRISASVHRCPWERRQFPTVEGRSAQVPLLSGRLPTVLRGPML